ncbi:hypothetical protein BX666DRAFT_1918650 [Dichotomocladium elegans]|nr:hypothetical protein BX666DRAFT_1918650 [Dichotomocladium elegans]
MIIPTDRKELLTIWRAATLSANRHVRSKFLTKRDLAMIDLADICDYILHHTLPLPVSAGLLLGMVKVAHHQSRFIYTEVLHLWVRIQRDMTTLHAMVDMPVTEANVRTITLKELPALDFGSEMDAANLLQDENSTTVEEHSIDSLLFAPHDGDDVERVDGTPATFNEPLMSNDQPFDAIDNNVLWSSDDFDFTPSSRQQALQQAPMLQQVPLRELATCEYSHIVSSSMNDDHLNVEVQGRTRRRQHRRQRGGPLPAEPDAATTVPARFYSHTDTLIRKVPVTSSSLSKKNLIARSDQHRHLKPLVGVAGMAMPHPIFWKLGYHRARINQAVVTHGERQQVESARRGMSETSSSGPSGIMPYLPDMVEGPWPHLPRAAIALHRDSSASSGQWTDLDDPGFYEPDNMSDIGERSFEMMHQDNASDQNDDDNGVRFLRHAQLCADQDDGTVDFDGLFTDPKMRTTIARGFYEVLSLASQNLLYPHQSEPFGLIRLTLRLPAAV